MEAKLRLTVKGRETVTLVLSGPERAIEDLLRQLRATGGRLDVTGAQCCWSMTSREATVHMIVDSDKVA